MGKRSKSTADNLKLRKWLKCGQLRVNVVKGGGMRVN